MTTRARGESRATGLAEGRGWDSWVHRALASAPAPDAANDHSDGASLLAAAEAAARLEAMAAAAKSRFLADAERAQAALGQGARTAAELFAERTRTSTAVAAGLVKAGDDQRRFPKLGEKFATGAVGAQHFRTATEQVRSISDALTREQRQQADELAANAAAASTVKGLRGLGEQLLAEVSPETQAEDLAERAARQRRRAWANRRFDCFDDGQGGMSFSGYLPVLEGRLLQTKVAALAKTPSRTPADGAERSGAQRRADALVDLVALAERGMARPGAEVLTGVLDRSGAGTGGMRPGCPACPGPGAPGATTTGGTRTGTTGGHDAMPPTGWREAGTAGDARVTGSTAGRAAAPVVDGDRPTLVVLLDHDALVRDLAALGRIACGEEAGRTGLVARTLAGDVLSPGDVRRLACEADLVPAVLGGDSEVLDIGRASRYATPAQRRALALRDRGCVFPGCHRPPEQCHKHHIRPWEWGGATDIDNLVLLCAHHHAECEPDPAKSPPHNWDIQLRDGVATLIPPLRVDRERKPLRHERFRRPPGSPPGRGGPVPSPGTVRPVTEEGAAHASIAHASIAHGDPPAALF